MVDPGEQLANSRLHTVGVVDTNDLGRHLQTHIETFPLSEDLYDTKLNPAHGYSTGFYQASPDQDIHRLCHPSSSIGRHRADRNNTFDPQD